MTRIMRNSLVFAAPAAALLMLGACTDNDVAGNDRGAEAAAETPPAQLAPASQAINQASLSKVYPGTLKREEITRVMASDSICQYAFTRAAKPVLAVGSPDGSGAVRGVMKLNGKLVALSSQPGGGDEGAISLAADGVAVSVTPLGGDAVNPGEEQDAVLKFKLDGVTELGFRGRYGCKA